MRAKRTVSHGRSVLCSSWCLLCPAFPNRSCPSWWTVMVSQLVACPLKSPGVSSFQTNGLVRPQTVFLVLCPSVSTLLELSFPSWVALLWFLSWACDWVVSLFGMELYQQTAPPHLRLACYSDKEETVANLSVAARESNGSQSLHLPFLGPPIARSPKLFTHWTERDFNDSS